MAATRLSGFTVTVLAGAVLACVARLGEATISSTIPSPNGGPEQFGTSCAISGNNVIIGAIDDDPYVAIYSASVVALDQIMLGDGTTFETNFLGDEKEWGSVVAIDGLLAAAADPDDVVTVSPGVFSRGVVSIIRDSVGDGSWAVEEGISMIDTDLSSTSTGPTTSDNFGTSIDVTTSGSSGDVLVVGAPGFSASGAVFVYRHNGSAWNTEQIIETANGDDIGKAVAVDGDRMLVGAPGADKVFFYHYDGSSWSLNATLDGGFLEVGDHVDISGDQAVAVEDSTRVRFYHYSNNAWAKEDDVGYSSAITGVSIEGNVAVAGAPAGDAMLKIDVSGGEQIGSALLLTGGTSFGTCVGITAAELAVAGAPLASGTLGEVTLFDFDSTSAPSLAPSAAPSGQPTAAPSRVPSAAPSAAPSSAPSGAPSSPPSSVPSRSPTAGPTAAPSMAPSSSFPSAAPSVEPSRFPSRAPSAAPTAAPSLPPSGAPTAAPSAASSVVPTAAPSAAPSGKTTRSNDYRSATYRQPVDSLVLTFMPCPPAAPAVSNGHSRVAMSSSPDCITECAAVRRSFRCALGRSVGRSDRRSIKRP